MNLVEPSSAQQAPGLPSDWPAKRKVTLVGAVANLGLAVGKVLVGIVGQSQALIADGVHSLSDLISDALVLIAARWGSHAADENHPYGHARIETVATAIVGILLLAVAAGFVYDSLSRLFNPELLRIPGWIVLIAAALSVLVKEALYHYTRRVATGTRSQLIAANAWHHRSDALSSVVVIVGAGGALAGFPGLDPVAAIIVAIMVGWVGWRFIGDSVAELVDTGLSAAKLEELDHLISSVDGVQGHRRLRTRRMAGQAFMDVQILLDPRLSLLEADQIAQHVKKLLIEKVPEMTDVVVGMRPKKEDNPSDT